MTFPSSVIAPAATALPAPSAAPTAIGGVAWRVSVALDAPLHTTFDYRHSQAVPVGSLVAVPFGSGKAAARPQVGLVVACVDEAAGQHTDDRATLPLADCKPLHAVWHALPPLAQSWLALGQFAAHYYLRGLGEVLLPALPANLRDAEAWPRYSALWQAHAYALHDAARAAQLAATLTSRQHTAHSLLAQLQAGALEPAALASLSPTAHKLLKAWHASGWITRLPRPQALLGAAPNASAVSAVAAPTLNAAQAEVVAQVSQALHPPQFAPFLLHGVTGSGKTEVYLHLIAQVLAAQVSAQVLLLVPEINLTPQFEKLVRARFPAAPLATLHSGMAEGERTRHWLAAHLGEARIVLGTRLALFASLPHLALVVVDEEHDASYKQQEGLRYSARDLAVWRAKQLGIPVVLGSATPSLESWYAAQQGRYRLLSLPQRAANRDGQVAQLPKVGLIDMQREAQHKRPVVDGLSQTLREAISERLGRGEQTLLYLNRRGYAPVLHCNACGWLSGCPRCSAHLVWHRHNEAGQARGALRCHHCGYEVPVPRSCPDCGNVDLSPLGRGTQKIEETLAQLFPQARVARIDADNTRRKGSAEALFNTVHAGEVDILVGTQMVAKGHDFQNVTLVGILNADAALFSHDFRASERLFAQLLQVSGRAGRAGQVGDVLVQTQYPQAAVYQALQRHDYVQHAQLLLDERRSALLPPFGFQVLLTVEAVSLDKALAFLESARQAAQTLTPCAEGAVICHDPVPRSMVRIARRERAQLLVESAQRQALQSFLDDWLPLLQSIRPRQAWQLERDPASL